MMRFMIGVCLMAMPLLESCSFHENYPNCLEELEDTGEHSNLTLLLSVNGDPSISTRSSENPLGGEEGNGLRIGEHHENDIDDLCVFAFSDPGSLGISNLNGDTPVKYCRYVDGIDFHPTFANSFYSDIISTEVKIQFEGKIVAATDAFLVVANMGDQTSSVHKLSDIRDMLVTRSQILTRPDDGNPLADCTSFAMANAHNSHNLGGRGTKQNPYLVSINLERITARVDFMYENTLADDNKPEGEIPANLLGYKVLNKFDENLQTGWLYISHIKLMNVAQYEPYTIKRFAYNEESPIEYLIDEEHIDDEATKYVVEPNTWKKGKVGAVTYSDLYGNTRVQNVVANYLSAFTTREAVRKYATPQTFPNANDGFNAGWSKDAISGESYYVLNYINENTVEKEYTSGLNTTSLLIKAKFIPKNMYVIEGSVLSARPANYNETFWMIEKKVGDTREKLYFKDETAANLYKATHPDGTYTAPVEYPGGDCYYTIWIRHDNNGVDTTYGKMEYGIVRNNIYRIGVNKIVGPGTVVPQANENPEDINTRIYVRKWNVIDIPTINI